MNWFDYWIGHCWFTGWQSIRGAFRIWSDLMTSNYKDYALLKNDNAEQECMSWFWVSLGEDNVYPKSFLEYLYDLVEKVDRGEVEMVPFNLDDLKDLDKLLEENDNDMDTSQTDTFDTPDRE